MASLAELSDLVGFFSYSREDDEDSKGKLSTLREAVGSELAQHLGRSKGKDFQLWQDQAAIAAGDDWESEIAKAIGQAAFFIPILTPRAVASKHCKFEFASFLARERALGRDDLIFPILYVPVPELLDGGKWRDDPVLSIVGKRQHFDWRRFRHAAPEAAYGEAIERFCEQIVAKLREPWLSLEERLQVEAEERARVRREALAKKRAEEEERARQEAEAERQTAEQERLRKEALAKKQAEQEAREREEADAKKRAAEEKREGPRKEALAKNRAPLTATQENALKPGDSFKEGNEFPEMVVVPAGSFLMGGPKSFWRSLTPIARANQEGESPQHEVTIAKAFAVARFALTFDEWDACAKRGGCRPDVSDHGWGRGRRPVIGVSWDDAQAYLKWLSGVTGKPYRLLSEAEWEYAARAGTKTVYPWGDKISLNGNPMANCKGCGSHWDGRQTGPVGSFPPNRFGLYDMIGNALEWTEDGYTFSYHGAPTDGSPRTNGDRGRRSLRGGSFNHDPDDVRAASRHFSQPDDKFRWNGFRVARTLNL
jgi:formylglycine-generating enzyme required for sulfatase activity